MQKITSVKELQAAIISLEKRQSEEGLLLKEQFSITYESLKPFNVLRKAIIDIFTPIELKQGILDTSAGILSGYLSRALVVRNSKNPILRLAGMFIQYGVTNVITKNSDAIMKVTSAFIEKLMRHSQKENS